MQTRACSLSHSLPFFLVPNFPHAYQISVYNLAPFGQYANSMMLFGDLVGAPRFELGTSCAQGRHSAQNNSSVFNATTETKQVSRDLRMWLAVRECPQMFVGRAQKLAHSKWYAGPGFVHGIVRLARIL
jgi:hypothetical protein